MAKDDPQLPATVSPEQQKLIATVLMSSPLNDGASLRESIAFVIAQAAAGRIPPESVAQIRSLMELAFTTMAFDGVKNTDTTSQVMKDLQKAGAAKDRIVPTYIIDVGEDGSVAESLGLKTQRREED